MAPSTNKPGWRGSEEKGGWCNGTARVLCKSGIMHHGAEGFRDVCRPPVAKRSAAAEGTCPSPAQPPPATARQRQILGYPWPGSAKTHPHVISSDSAQEKRGCKTKQATAAAGVRRHAAPPRASGPPPVRDEGITGSMLAVAVNILAADAMIRSGICSQHALPHTNQSPAAAPSFCRCVSS